MTCSDVCGLRWKIEQFHRETKQVTGLEGCQCRKVPMKVITVFWRKGSPFSIKFSQVTAD